MMMSILNLIYHNSLYHNLPNSQLNRLQQIQNSLARAVVKAPKSLHVTPILKSLHCRSTNALNINFFLLPTKFLKPVNLAILTIWSLFIPSQYPLLVCCHSFSPTNHLLIENRSLIQIYITPSLNPTPRFIPSASPVMSRLTSPFTCQCISVIITTVIIHHSFTLSLQAQNLPFQQILSTVDFFYLPDCLHDHGTGPDLSCFSIYF